MVSLTVVLSNSESEDTILFCLNGIQDSIFLFDKYNMVMAKESLFHTLIKATAIDRQL